MAKENPQKYRAQTREKAQKGTSYRFLNPYNFVRYLPERPTKSDDPLEVQLLERCPPPPHDRWVGLSGKIECKMVAITPVFVAGSEGVQPDQKEPRHKHFRFFNIGGQKMIPASSLRGPVRSVFEMITNSCFANFAGARLSYRLETGEARRLVPACVEKTDDGRFVLRLLYGTAELNPDYPPKELYASPVRQYEAYKPTGRKRNVPPPPPVNLKGKGHGASCWAVLQRMKFPPSWRVVQVADTQQEAAALLRKEEARARQRSAQPDQSRAEFAVQQGWLCITNQNTDNKHSERFFFADESIGGEQVIELKEPIRREYEDLIEDYQRRHAPFIQQWKSSDKDVRALSRPFVKDPRNPEKKEMAYSRFILNLEKKDGKVQGGELVYAMLRGRGKHTEVEFIAPVSVPRVAYKRCIGDLLPGHLKRCSVEEALCPACRVFGWVRGEREEQGAYAGRVYFSHARLTKSNPQGPRLLAILGSPKPTTTRFYLVGPNGRPSETPRSDTSAGYDGNDGKNQLRGRKVYRHHLLNDPRSRDPEFPFAKKPSDQNRTIEDPEGEGAEFEFTVEFENLAPVELGALLWALEVGGKGYHRLGYGKPLGLGSVEISVKHVQCLDPQARYRHLDDQGYRQVTAWRIYVQKFEKAMEALWGKSFYELAPVRDLLALVGRQEPLLPVHYPFSPDPRTQGRFEWFVGNKRKDGPKVELGLAVEDKGLPLIDRTGKIHDSLSA